jgi:hypothetical protein
VDFTSRESHVSVSRHAWAVQYSLPFILLLVHCKDLIFDVMGYRLLMNNS